MGVGLGNSVQKLFICLRRIPILCFLFGRGDRLIGATAMIALFVMLIARVLNIGWRVAAQHRLFEAYVFWSSLDVCRAGVREHGGQFRLAAHKV